MAIVQLCLKLPNNKRSEKILKTLLFIDVHWYSLSCQDMSRYVLWWRNGIDNETGNTLGLRLPPFSRLLEPIHICHHQTCSWSPWNHTWYDPIWPSNQTHSWILGYLGVMYILTLEGWRLHALLFKSQCLTIFHLAVSYNVTDQQTINWIISVLLFIKWSYLTWYPHFLAAKSPCSIIFTRRTPISDQGDPRGL
jgi:hypothetical protein